MAEKAKYRIKCRVPCGKYEPVVDTMEIFNAGDVSYESAGVKIEATDGMTHFYPYPQLIRMTVEPLGEGA